MSQCTSIYVLCSISQVGIYFVSISWSGIMIDLHKNCWIVFKVAEISEALLQEMQPNMQMDRLILA